ncbi:MAG TPA: hypothetical protein VG406_28355 [Isosphaeraceae bacterium]|jgi:hypothetical protein|nr:hypothetical protein [Isosphaeraceae bacterium]
MKSPKFWLRVAFLATLLGLPMFSGCGDTTSSTPPATGSAKTSSATP